MLAHGFISDSLLSELVKCSYIGMRTHNTDYINKTLAEEMGITVCGLSRQYGVNAVAEHTFMLILALAKNLVNSYQNTISGRWREALGPNAELSGKKIGIIGCGQIGKRVAEIASFFGMEVLVAGKEKVLKKDELPVADVVSRSDIISVHIPATPENKGTKESIDKMNEELINNLISFCKKNNHT